MAVRINYAATNRWGQCLLSPHTLTALLVSLWGTIASLEIRWVEGEGKTMFSLSVPDNEANSTVSKCLLGDDASYSPLRKHPSSSFN